MIEAGDFARLSTAVEPLRREPAHASELVSEILGGERFQCLRRQGEWLEVQGEDGYRGWLHEWTCLPWEGEAVEFVGRYRHPLGTLWVSDNFAASPLLMGTPLLRPEEAMVERGDRHLVRTPWGSEGWLAESDLLEFSHADVSVADVLKLARRLLGTPYRWGGRSPLGFDCSGYLQYVFALCDRRLPRDASQQAQVGVDVEEGAWQRGDLLFFGEPVDHVAMLVGEDRILHCSARVREERLGENPQLRGRLCTVRRVFDAATDLGESWWAGRDAAHRT